MVITLSGSPAVLAACGALCLPGVDTQASTADGATVAHAAHSPVPAVAALHVHHGSPVSAEAATAPATLGSSPAWSHAAVSPACSECCSDRQTALVAGAGVERVDAFTLRAAPAASPVPGFLLTTAVGGASPSGPPRPPVPPPSPARAVLVLRI
jgi:hypothetical protein